MLTKFIMRFCFDDRRPVMKLHVICCIFLLFCCCARNAEALNPVVLVPGLGDSRIEARLNKTHSRYFFCWRHSDWHWLWLEMAQTGAEYCFVENMKLFFNQSDGTTSNFPGVDIRVPGFGSTDTIETLNSFHWIPWKRLKYYFQLVERLKAMKYVKNVSLRGAPYDFRKAPNEMGTYFENLSKLIEDTYEMNNNKKIVIIAHSMGCINVLYFLRRKSPEWKEKYIACFISMGAPWAGSAKIVRSIVSGKPLGLPDVFSKSKLARELFRTFPSSLWMMPRREYWSADEALVISPKRNYTVNDLDQLFRDVDFEQGVEMKRRVHELFKAESQDDGYGHPGVRTFCLYGLVEPYTTPDRFIYRKNIDRWFDEAPTTAFGPGDGTVNKRSLELCRNWPNTTVIKFDGIEHTDILREDEPLDVVESILRQL